MVARPKGLALEKRKPDARRASQVPQYPAEDESACQVENILTCSTVSSGGSEGKLHGADRHTAKPADAEKDDHNVTW